MGTAASVHGPLTKDQVREFAGGQFDEALFDSMADADGKITYEQWISVKEHSTAKNFDNGTYLRLPQLSQSHGTDRQSLKKFASEMFDHITAKMVNFITVDELKKILVQELNIALKSDELEELALKVMDVMDVDKDYKIQREEWIKFYMGTLSTEEKKKAFFGRLYFDKEQLAATHETFKKYSNDGFIGPAEARTMLSEILDVELPQEEAKALVDRVIVAGDTSGKGRMNERDFRRFHMKYLHDEQVEKWATDVHKQVEREQVTRAAQALFKKYDTDNSGWIDRAELETLLTAELQVQFHDKKLQSKVVKIIQKSDRDGNSQVDQTEFLKVYKLCLASEERKKKFLGHYYLSAEHRAKAKALFDRYDTDGSGSIKTGEMKTLIEDIGLDLKDDEKEDFINGVVTVADKTGDGVVQIEEFFRFYRKCLITPEKMEAYKQKVLNRYSDRRKRKAQIERERTKAAIVIQRHFRGMKLRKRMNDLFSAVINHVTFTIASVKIDRTKSLKKQHSVRIKRGLTVKTRNETTTKSNDEVEESAVEPFEKPAQVVESKEAPDTKINDEVEESAVEPFEKPDTSIGPSSIASIEQVIESKEAPDTKTSDVVEESAVVAFNASDLNFDSTAGVLPSEEKEISTEKLSSLSVEEQIALFKDGDGDLPADVLEEYADLPAHEQALLAAEDGDVAMLIRTFVRNQDSGLDINAIAEDGVNPLMQCALYSGGECIEALLKLKADPNITDHDGTAPIHMLAYRNNAKALRSLLDHGKRSGLEINKAVPKSNATALYLAAQENYVPVLRELVRFPDKCGINDRANGDSTPLHMASYCGHIQAVNLLVNAKAAVSMKNLQGATPLAIATQNGHADVVSTLLAHGADPLEISQHNTLIMLAVLHGHREIVGLFLKYLTVPQIFYNPPFDQRRSSFLPMPLTKKKASSQTSVAVAATFVGDFDILAMIVDACDQKGEEPKNGFFFPKILDHIFGLNLKQARRVDPEKVIGADKYTTDKSGMMLFNRHSKQGKMTRNDLANCLAKLKLKSKYGSHFNSLVTLMYNRCRSSSQPFLRSEDFLEHVRQMYFLQRCPKAKGLTRKYCKD